MTDTIANESPGHDHATAHSGSSVNQFRLTLPRSGRELLIAVILGISIFVNVWTSIEYMHLSQVKWLHDYDLDTFKSTEFADLKTEVEVSQKLFQTCKR